MGALSLAIFAIHHDGTSVGAVLALIGIVAAGVVLGNFVWAVLRWVAAPAVKPQRVVIVDPEKRKV